MRLNYVAEAPMTEWLSGNQFEPELDRLNRLLKTSSAEVGGLFWTFLYNRPQQILVKMAYEEDHGELVSQIVEGLKT